MNGTLMGKKWYMVAKCNRIKYEYFHWKMIMNEWMKRDSEALRVYWLLIQTFEIKHGNEFQAYDIVEECFLYFPWLIRCYCCCAFFAFCFAIYKCKFCVSMVHVRYGIFYMIFVCGPYYHDLVSVSLSFHRLSWSHTKHYFIYVQWY